MNVYYHIKKFDENNELSLMAARAIEVAAVSRMKRRATTMDIDSIYSLLFLKDHDPKCKSLRES